MKGLLDSREAFSAAFDTRTLNALREEGIETFRHLVEYEAGRLMMIPGIGRAAVRKIRERLHTEGLRLKGEAPEGPSPDQIQKRLKSLRAKLVRTKLWCEEVIRLIDAVTQ
ncbi:MAG TPA: DNA-directed RNA polymerase subunit alpha C-terminal domain-containing protein [Gammaproteobacteria bacterium]|nr:DNA-directed RNA polymerase subunit alpha C-terminal domain-containing protein [Gammaproteobacteria bacterium]